MLNENRSGTKKMCPLFVQRIVQNTTHYLLQRRKLTAPFSRKLNLDHVANNLPSVDDDHDQENIVPVSNVVEPSYPIAFVII